MSIRDILRDERVVPPALFDQMESSGLPLESIGIDVLQLSRRSYNALTRSGIDSVDKLVCLKDTDLARIPNIGITSFQEIVTNANDYLQRITRPQEIQRLFRTSLIELMRQNEDVESWSPASFSLRRLVLEKIPLSGILANQKLLDQLANLGLSSSLDIWILAFGYHVKADKVFSQWLTEVGDEIAGPWHAGRPVSFHTSVQEVHLPCASEIEPSLSCSCLKVNLVFEVSSDSSLHWEALLPPECLSIRIEWSRHDDKTKGLCTFLKQRASSIAHWAEPEVGYWDRLPRYRPIDAFLNWISSIKGRTVERDYQMFSDWFGLTSGDRNTLEDVGNKNDVTRERIRQIVKRFTKSLMHPYRRKYLNSFVSHFDSLLLAHGGVMTIREIVEACGFFDDFTALSPIHTAELLLAGCNKFHAIDHQPFKDRLSSLALSWVTWAMTQVDSQTVIRARETAIQLVRKDPLKYNGEDLRSLVSNITDIDKELVAACLRTCRALQDSRLGYSLLSNGESRLTTNQMAVAALRELLVPARCPVIHKKIQEMFPGQNVDIGTLRNTLSSGRFCTVAPGIYGLVEYLKDHMIRG